MSLLFEDAVRQNVKQHPSFQYGADASTTKKFQKTYRIDPSETILAHMTKKVLFGLIPLDGIVITEKTLYVNSKHCSESFPNRIPIDEICQYVVFHEKDTAPVFLLDSLRKKHEVWSETISDADTGNNLTGFLKDLQRYLVETDPIYSELHGTTVQNILNEGRLILRHSGFSSDKRDILLSLCEESENTFLMVFDLLMEDITRRLPYAAYLEEIKAMPQEYSDRFFAAYEKNIEDFKIDLTDLSFEIDIAYLKEVYSALKVEVNPSRTALLIQGFVCVRTLQFSELKRIFQALHTAGADDYVVELRQFQVAFSNHQMKKIFYAIKNGEELDKNLLSISDSIGLTPLHYALILRKDDIVVQLLRARTWNPIPDTKNVELIALYDYINLARLVNSEALFKVIGGTSDLVKVHLKSKTAIENKQKVWTGILNGMRAVQQRLYEVARSSEDPSYFSEKIEAAEEQIVRMKAYLDSLSDSYREICEEIEICIDDLLRRADTTINNWKKSETPLVKYIFKLFSDPDFLEEFLAEDPQKLILCYYGDFFFAVPANSRVVSSSCTENFDQPTDDISSIKKPYGGSWFSSMAHKDTRILCAEYRKLAKIYHPDVSSSANATKIFQSILNERADILDKLRTPWG